MLSADTVLFEHGTADWRLPQNVESGHNSQVEDDNPHM
jgi:hypothetical protein